MFKFTIADVVRFQEQYGVERDDRSWFSFINETMQLVYSRTGNSITLPSAAIALWCDQRDTVGAMAKLEAIINVELTSIKKRRAEEQKSKLAELLSDLPGVPTQMRDSKLLGGVKDLLDCIRDQAQDTRLDAMLAALNKCPGFSAAFVELAKLYTKAVEERTREPRTRGNDLQYVEALEELALVVEHNIKQAGPYGHTAADKIEIPTQMARNICDRITRIKSNHKPEAAQAETASVSQIHPTVFYAVDATCAALRAIITERNQSNQQVHSGLVKAADALSQALAPFYSGKHTQHDPVALLDGLNAAASTTLQIFDDIDLGGFDKPLHTAALNAVRHLRTWKSEGEAPLPTGTKAYKSPNPNLAALVQVARRATMHLNAILSTSDDNAPPPQTAHRVDVMPHVRRLESALLPFNYIA